MKYLIPLTLIIAILSGCSTTSTQITGSWKNPQEANKTYNSIIVTALTDNIQAKTTVETDLAQALASQGLTVKKSMDVMPPDFTKETTDKDALLSRIRENGADAILTVSLIDRETESRYVPGDYGYAPATRYGYYGMFWGYYSYWQPLVYSPGYYTEDKTYFIETNLYDAATEKLIWSAQSETYNPTSLSEFSDDFAAVIVRDLKENGVI